MKRALTLGLLLLATAVTAAEFQLSTKHTELRALSLSRMPQFCESTALPT